MRANLTRTFFFFAAILIASTSLPGQQMPDMPMEQAHTQHEHMQMNGVQATYPRMGRAQEQAQGKLFTLEQAQQLASESNPTLRQAEAEIRAAEARQQQSGLYPNPTVGYSGDEIRGGSVAGGKQGFFVQQTIVTGGKLANNRQVFSKETQIAQIEAEEQKTRVQTAIRTGFLRVLAAQELLDARRDLAKIEQDYAETEHQLGNTGQADETEILQAEISARRQKLGTHMQENALLEEWRALAAVIGKPDLPLMVVSGELQTGWPELNEEQIADKIAGESPATRIAATAAQRADAEIHQAKHATIPDLELRGGLQYNNEPLGSLPPHATGWEGLADVAVQIPIFNRNQGNVSAAQAESERAKLEMQRVSLTLRQRATSVLDEYANAKLMAVEYRQELLPRAQKAYTLMNEKYGQMLASYPRVIETQRKLFQLQCEYIQALEAVWITGMTLEGFLLTDGLESPARPSEVDRPVREINVPLSEQTATPAAIP
ncbi:MAG TPA: TolC family protein [Candidatus Acidoferrum sp.]|jgi:cobalt-zinc-cadmium efflux system outer membrane protein